MNKRTYLKSNDGFTAIELLVVLAVISAVAYLVLPILFPSDSKTPEQYIEEDLTSIAEVLTLRQMTAAVNDIKVEDIYIGNLGVYSAKSQVRHSITINTADQEITYCLRGDYRGVTRYYEFPGSAISTEPSGLVDCPGISATVDSTNSESSDQTTDAPAEEAPSEANTTDPAEEVAP